MSKISRSFSISLWAAALLAQAPGVLTVVEPAKLAVKRGESPLHKLRVRIQRGYHANSNTPNEKYLIPLKLTWEPGPLTAEDVIYPTPKLEKYEFSELPVSVFDGEFEITTKFKWPTNPPLGPGMLSGKLRYQACTGKLCLPPKTVDVKVPVVLQ